jgi:hypothetical protein
VIRRLGRQDGGLRLRLQSALRTENSGWQRDLSVSYDRVGDVQVAQGNLPEALKSFRDGLGIRERLAKADPENSGWQRDLSVSHQRLGHLYLSIGQPEQARVSLAAGRAIVARLVSDHRGFVQWEQDLATFDQLIAASGT